MTPTFDLHAAIVLESAEDILSTTTVDAEAAFATFRRGGDAAITAPVARSVELAPQSLDGLTPPQSYPAVRLAIVGTTKTGNAINNGIANVAHVLEVRSFTSTSGQMTTLAAAGKRTTSTTGYLRALHEAKAVLSALTRDLVMHTVNSTVNNVYNVRVLERGACDLYATQGAGRVYRTIMLLEVYQRVRSTSVGYPSFVLADVAALSSALHLWVFAGDAPDNDTGSSGAAELNRGGVGRIASTVGGAQGALDFASTYLIDLGGGLFDIAAPRAQASVVQSLDQDRALEMAWVWPTGGDPDGALVSSSAASHFGELTHASNALTWTAPDDTSVTLIADTSSELGKVIYLLVAYDHSAATYTAYVRIAGAAEATAALAQATEAGAAASMLAFGSYDYDSKGQSSEMDLHHAAFFDTIPSALHRAAMHARLDL